jgi:hypothetical protein
MLNLNVSHALRGLFVKFHRISSLVCGDEL